MYGIFISSYHVYFVSRNLEVVKYCSRPETKNISLILDVLIETINNETSVLAVQRCLTISVHRWCYTAFTIQLN